MERHITLPSRRMPFKGRRSARAAAAALALASVKDPQQRGGTGRIFGARRNPEADGGHGGGGGGEGDHQRGGGRRRKLLTIRWPQPLLAKSYPNATATAKLVRIVVTYLISIVK